MSTKYAIGSDGSCTLPSGFNARLNTWSATLTRTTSVTTGFGASVHNRRASAVLDITGSAGGVPIYYDGSGVGGDGSFAPIKHATGGTTLDDREGGNITLTTAIATGSTTVCSLTFGAVFNSFAFNVTNDGDSTVTFGFEMNDGDGPTVAWDESG